MRKIQYSARQRSRFVARAPFLEKLILRKVKHFTLIVYFCWIPASVISKFLSSLCMEGVRKIDEMEKKLFQDGFIPERLHNIEVPSSIGEDHNYSNSDVQNNPQTAVDSNQEQSEPSENVAGHAENYLDDENDTLHAREQPFYGLIDLEKTLLQAISAIACDGNAMLDALVYFTIVPIDGIIIVRSVVFCYLYLISLFIIYLLYTFWQQQYFGRYFIDNNMCWEWT